jgi:nucleoside-diphosphate-sugar epimerase
MAGKRFLVTGGTGFIGSALVFRLIKEGHYVRVLDNDLRGVQERLAKISHEIDMVKADIRDANAVSAALRDIDIVCHLAYLNGTEFFYEKPELVLDIGVKGMVNIIDGCIKNNVRELVLASSSEVYQTPPVVPTDETVPLSVPDPLNPRYSYGGGKIICELMAINYGRKHFDKVVIFRPHNVYGPDMGWEHVIPQLAIRMKNICDINQEIFVAFPIQGSGEETRSFVFIDDFIDGLMLVIEKGEHLNIYHIGTMDEIPIKGLATAIGAIFGKEIGIVQGAAPAGGTPRRCPDISKLTAIGYSPKISLHDGLRSTVSWYVDNIDKMPVNKLKG